MKASYLIAIIILFLSFSIQAQDPYLIDSLTKSLEGNQPSGQVALNDTTRIRLLLDLGWELKYHKPDTSILLGKEALSILSDLLRKEGVNQSPSIKKAIQTLIASANSDLGVYYWFKADYPLSLSHHFKALEIKKQLKDRKAVGGSLGNIASVYLHQGDYPRALEHYLAALDIDRELQDSFGEAQDLSNIGNLYRTQGDYANALIYFNQALEIMKKSGDKLDIAMSLGNIANVYSEQGDFPRALKRFFEALQIFEELGAKARIATLHGNLGVIYNDQSDYPNALKHHAKALEIDEELGKKNSIVGHLNNIGVIYKNQGDYTNALKHHFESLNLAKELGIKQSQGTALGNIGIVYYNQAEEARSKQDMVGCDTLYSKALDHYEEALSIAKEIGSKTGILKELGNIGVVYSRQAQSGFGEAEIRKKKYEEAERYLKEALALADSIGYLMAVRAWNLDLSELYDQTQRYDLALKHFRQYSAVKDTLFNEEKSKDIGKLEAKHDFAMATAEQKRHEEAQAQEAIAIKSRRNNLQYSGILIFLVLVFASVFGLAKISIPIRLAEGLIFFSFLLFFEFTLVLLDPYIEQYSSGGPAIKLGFNAVLAGFIFPLHSFFETQLKGRLFKSSETQRVES